MRYAVSAFLLTALVGGLNAQVTWAGLATYGGSSYDMMWGIDFRGDSLPVLLLFTISYSISGSDEDYILMTPRWKRVIGNTGGRDDWAYKVAWLNGGSIVVGGTWCYDGGAGPGSCYAPLYGFLTQLNSSGDFLRGRHLDFANSWGCSGESRRQTRVLSVSPTNDGGFVAAGYMSYCESTGDQDAFIAKFDSNLNLQWIKPVGTTDYEFATTAFQTTDGNYVLIAPSFYEIWIGKFNGSGNLIWQKRYPRRYAGGGKYFAWGKPTSDGGFILADEIDGPGSGRDALFAKFDSMGNFVCGRILYTGGDDVGIDVVEGDNYYWMTGFFRSSDLFIAAFNKSDCRLVKFRYLLSSGTESGRAIDLSDNGIPYVAGFTSNPAWSRGGYDGLVAADSGGLDTCYWRSYSIPNTSLHLSRSGSWTVYSFHYSPSSYSVSVDHPSIGSNVICGLALGSDDTDLSTEERYGDCFINYGTYPGGVKVRVKARTDVSVEVYSPDGRRVAYVSKAGFSGVLRIPLKPGMYFLRIRHDLATVRGKVVIR